MVTPNEKYLISQLPQTEYGQALNAYLNERISEIESNEGINWKICDDPLNQDFRVQMGVKMGLKEVRDMPGKCTKELRQGESK